jgi:hypothetical protein
MELLKMRQWLLHTMNEGSDSFYYFILHPTKPTKKELLAFLVKYQSYKDTTEQFIYESPYEVVEIRDMKSVPKDVDTTGYSSYGWEE